MVPTVNGECPKQIIAPEVIPHVCQNWGADQYDLVQDGADQGDRRINAQPTPNRRAYAKEKEILLV
jgi:hypothetical protein